VISLHDPGFLQTSGFNTGFANDTEVQCPMLLWVWLQFELECDDPRNTAPMMPLSHYCLEGKDWGRDCGDDLLRCGDDEV